MSPVLTTFEIWQLGLIRLLFYIFLGAGILIYFKWRKPLVFVTLIAGFLGATYAVLIQGAHLTWWGLQGDELFVTAFLDRVAHGQFFSDFYYGSLPPFYPPLYFWLVGGLGFLFRRNGIEAAQIGVALVLVATPLLLYAWQRWYWKKLPTGSMPIWSMAVTAGLVFVVYDWSAIILKPYEFISAVLVTLWTAFLLQELELESLKPVKLLMYGISGGLLFLTFYFWFLPVLLATLLWKLLSPTRGWYYWSNLAIIAVIILVISLPFTAPLVATYLQLGAENWQPAFFVAQDLNLYLPFFNFSVFGLLAAGGLATIIFYWRRPYVRALGCLLSALYLWHFINMATITWFQAPFLSSKPFLFIGGAILMIAAAYGIGQVVITYVKNSSVQAGFFVIGWVVLGSQLLGGNYLDTPGVAQQLVVMKQELPEEIGQLIDHLYGVKGIEQLTVLSSGIPEISTYLPLNLYVSHNIHFSHPAAHFSDRYNFVRLLAVSPTPKAFYQQIKQAPFGPIDALLLFKSGDQYPILFQLDNYPNGVVEQQLNIPTSLIDPQYFDTVFEDKHFVLFKVK